ncbi:hibernation-specific plasma protein HP-55-like [Thalassophryne amazonica]|uniref:hibernation-specific plasma protein HP-55-like n=1 Tax=Thalassophryne amazonica TaxID=390379 RepID=UPI001471FF0B|nr:hibernation-specific plasma protein HP-55-like [Thalassophryne amazonica]
MKHTGLSVWIFSAVICVGRGQINQDTAPDSSANSLSLVNEANKEFTFQLYRKLVAQPGSEGKNVFFSPASVSMALAALATGAKGQTHHQIFSGLGYNDSVLTQADIDQSFHSLLVKENKTCHEDVSEGTAVFVDDHFKVKPEFLENLKKFYLADGFTVNFTETKDSANKINKYVEEKTNGKIDNLVEDLDPLTVMYLLSYIYYKGKWETPFDPKLTKEEIFHVDANTKVPVPMMNSEGDFDVYIDRQINTSVLRLPFSNSYSMLLLLSDNLAAVEDVISARYVTKWLKWMKPSEYDVFVPKFSIKTRYELNNVLKEMGMTDMFGDADLSGISEGKKLVVSDIVHQATLDVDEGGATAAAATGVNIMLLSLRIVPVLKFNQPFIALITEQSTGKILFMGKIVNPTI